MMAFDLISKKAALLLALALMPLFLAGAGCGSSIPTIDTEYHTGTEGLVMSLVGDESLNDLYEDSNFGFNIELKNKGAYDVVGDDQAILSISYDPLYISLSDIGQADENIEVTQNGIMVKHIQLRGKSRYAPNGDLALFSFTNFKTNEIMGQRAEPETKVFASLCYPYATTLSKLVCVDFNIYNQNLRNQVCTQKDLSVSDQGAPVAITRVEVENQPAPGNLVRPVFTITVTNKGNGLILSPVISGTELERVCSSSEVAKDDFNTVKIDAQLSDSVVLKCVPDIIRINFNEGKTRCMVSDEDLNDVISYRQNYQSPLTINLSYVYMSTLQKSIKIQRFNIFGGSAEDTGGCLSYQVQEGSNCVSRCEYCANHPADSSCQPGSSQIDYNPSFSCSCSKSTCDSLYTKGLCVPYQNFCPGVSFCCAPACKTSEARLDNGKCYPKCSQCSAAAKDCACGNTEGGFALVTKGSYCCPLTKESHGSAAACREDCTKKTA